MIVEIYNVQGIIIDFLFWIYLQSNIEDIN